MKFPGQDQIHDQIEDTGENEESNIMYFRSFDKEQILSDQQAEIIKRGALVY